MGELRNRLERRGKSWLGITGHQIGTLLQMYYYSKGRVDCPVAGEPAWWQSARSLTRKELIHQIEYRRTSPNYLVRGLRGYDAYEGRGYALTPKGWALCQRIITAFPQAAAEAEAEAARYFRNKEAA